MKDLKAALGNSAKPDITHCRTPFLNYTSRACMYGSFKYERSNFIRPTGDGPHATPTREDFERFRAYLRAAASHIFQTLDAMERHQSGDPTLLDVEGMRRAAFAVDTDVTPGAKIGASLLPHVSPACASLNMAITQAADCGLLPADPGPTWEVKSEPIVNAPDRSPFPGGYGSGRLLAVAASQLRAGDSVKFVSGSDSRTFKGRESDDYNHFHTNTGVCACRFCNRPSGAV